MQTASHIGMSDGELLAIVNPLSFSSQCTSIELKDFRLKTVQQEPVIGDAVQIFLIFIRKHDGPKHSHTRSPTGSCFFLYNSKEILCVDCGNQKLISRVRMFAILVFHGGK